MNEPTEAEIRAAHAAETQPYEVCPGKTRAYAADYLFDHRAVLLRLLDEARAERDGWRESAAQFLRNQEFYHGLVTQIGEKFGPPAYTSDDGSVQDSVLALRVPELVDALRAERDAALAEAEANRRDAERLKSAVRWALGYDEGEPDFGSDFGPGRYAWRTELRRRAAMQESTTERNT